MTSQGFFNLGKRPVARPFLPEAFFSADLPGPLGLFRPLADVVKESFEEMPPETAGAGERGNVYEPGTRVFLGEEPEALKEVGFSRSGFPVENETPRLIPTVNRLDRIQATLECLSVYFHHILKGLLPRRIHPVLEEGVGNPQQKAMNVLFLGH
jgi:hypothetical protein